MDGAQEPIPGLDEPGVDGSGFGAAGTVAGSTAPASAPVPPPAVGGATKPPSSFAKRKAVKEAEPLSDSGTNSDEGFSSLRQRKRGGSGGRSSVLDAHDESACDREEASWPQGATPGTGLSLLDGGELGSEGAGGSAGGAGAGVDDGASTDAVGVSRLFTVGGGSAGVTPTTAPPPPTRSGAPPRHQGTKRQYVPAETSPLGPSPVVLSEGCDPSSALRQTSVRVRNSPLRRDAVPEPGADDSEGSVDLQLLQSPVIDVTLPTLDVFEPGVAFPSPSSVVAGGGLATAVSGSATAGVGAGAGGGDGGADVLSAAVEYPGGDASGDGLGLGGALGVEIPTDAPLLSLRPPSVSGSSAPLRFGNDTVGTPSLRLPLPQLPVVDTAAAELGERVVGPARPRDDDDDDDGDGDRERDGSVVEAGSTQ